MSQIYTGQLVVKPLISFQAVCDFGITVFFQTFTTSCQKSCQKAYYVAVAGFFARCSESHHC